MKKLITSILTIVMVMSSISVFAKDYSNYKQKFWDVPKTHWAFEAVSELVDKNVINGYEDGSFKPDRTVNRGEWAKMMVTAANLDISDNTTVHCSDLVNHWSNRYVNAAINYLPSYNDGTYRPDMMITRDVVTASMVRLKGYNIEDVDYSILSQFRDVETIGNYMKAYVAVAVEKGLISGFEDNTFRGQDTLTRAEAATILNRAFQLGDNNIQMDVNNQSSGNNSDIGYDGFKPEPTKKPDVEDKNNTQNEDKSENNKTNKDEEKDNVKDEIKENKKGYKIETLVKGNLLTYGQISDDLYYQNLDTNEICKINMITRDEESKSIDDFSINIDEQEYKIKKIHYGNVNRYTNELNLYCSVYYKDILNNGDKIKYLVINYNFDVINENPKEVNIDGDFNNDMNENGSWREPIFEHASYRPLEFDENSNIIIDNGDWKAIRQIHEKDNAIYYSCSKGIRKYDYENIYSIIDTFGGNAWGFTNQYIYTISTYNDLSPNDGRFIAKCDYNGKVVDKIDFNDIEITDKKKIYNNNSAAFSLNEANIEYNIFINSNGDIAINDLKNQCFRIISENK